MAKRGRKRKSIAGYFKSVFATHPEWLQGKSNAPLLEQYRKDKGLGAEAKIPNNIKANLANIKSVLRKHGRKKTGRKMISVKAVAAVRGTKLEALEELIDDCMTLAKNIDREGLSNIIGKLRSARNEVVWKTGK